MPIPADCMTLEETNIFVSEFQGSVWKQVEQVVLRRSPYLDSLKPGNFPLGVSREIRSIVQEPAAMASSLTKPVFQQDPQMCGVAGERDRTGTTEYTYGLETFRGLGEEICVKEARYAVQNSFVRSAEALSNGIKQIVNADIRYLLLSRSGLKFTLADGHTFGQMLKGDMQNIDTDFANFLPTSPMTWKALERLTEFLEYDMMADQYESPTGEMYKAMVSKEQLNLFRDELTVKEDLRAMTTGQYKIGAESLQGFKFMGPWRGVAFGVDVQPLRFNVLGSDGLPALIEPVVTVNVTNGVAQRINIDWTNATYEVMFLMAPNSFERQTPSAYTGEGKAKFSPHNVLGDLQWHYQKDNTCNIWEDFGFYKYEINRAYRPVRPHHVIAIAYKRCNRDLGAYACHTSGNGL